MTSSNTDTCSQIRGERRFGYTRCGIIEGQVALIDVARAFGLADDEEVYSPVGRAEAALIAIHILSTSLAYGSEIMSPARAADLWRQFLELFDDQTSRFLSNCPCGLDSWNSATNATFDKGVLVIGASRSGCLWIEEED